jgi:hypothetical protein
VATPRIEDDGEARYRKAAHVGMQVMSVTPS